MRDSTERVATVGGVFAARAVTCLTCGVTMPADDIGDHRAVEHDESRHGMTDSPVPLAVLDLVLRLADEAIPDVDPAGIDIDHADRWLKTMRSVLDLLGQASEHRSSKSDGALR